MAAVSLTPADLAPFAVIDEVKAEAMIEDAVAMAERVAPCITSDAFEHDVAARAILRGAILRWHESGTGALQSQQVGPFGQSYDTRVQRKGMFWPSEIEQLQDLCRTGTEAQGAYAVDMVGGRSPVVHADICSLNFGATYCSCGAVLTGMFALYEQGYGY